MRYTDDDRDAAADIELDWAFADPDYREWAAEYGLDPDDLGTLHEYRDTF